MPDTPVYDLSPWLDMHLRSTEEVFALLGAQRHRRFIKTHAPLDGLPWHESVTYITVGRDPRDAFVSMQAHGASMDRERLHAVRTAAVGHEEPDRGRWPADDDPRALVESFLEIEQHPNHADVNLANLLHHLRLAWRARHHPNVHLTHYVDLRADLPGEMLRLRDVLGVGLDDDRVAALAELATIESMRSRAEEVAPEANMGVWKDPSTFFRAGRHGDGEAMMTEAELRRYDERCAELVDDPDLLAWVHGGRTAADPDRR